MTGESSLISNVWTQRSLGLDLSKNKMSKSIVHTDVEYVCNNVYPFLQLVNADAVFTDDTSVNFITASTGWIIHDYGEALSVAAPNYIKVKQKKDNKAGDAKDGGGDDSSSSGSSGGGIITQITTVAEIAALIAEKGWAAVELIAGTSMMQKFLWIESKRYGFGFKGYAPSADDEKCYDRLCKNAKANNLVWEKRVTTKHKPENQISGAG